MGVCQEDAYNGPCPWPPSQESFKHSEVTPWAVSCQIRDPGYHRGWHGRELRRRATSQSFVSAGVTHTLKRRHTPCINQSPSVAPYNRMMMMMTIHRYLYRYTEPQQQDNQSHPWDSDTNTTGFSESGPWVKCSSAVQCSADMSKLQSSLVWPQKSGVRDYSWFNWLLIYVNAYNDKGQLASTQGWHDNPRPLLTAPADFHEGTLLVQSPSLQQWEEN